MKIFISLSAKQTRVRKISDIAKEIQEDWKNVSIHAKPYLTAMLKIDSIDSMYKADHAAGIVAYFLNNARGWVGENARRIKKELNSMVTGYYKGT